MTTYLKPRYRQTGAYLLEALIGILIFALGVLGIVGLQAASLRTSTDNSLRAEAVFAATQLMGQMWADVQGTLVANYSSAAAGPTYTAWAAELKAAQGAAWVQDPTVDFANATLQCRAIANEQRRLYPDPVAVDGRHATQLHDLRADRAEPTMKPILRGHRRATAQGGFSLIEIMVGVVIGMIAVLVIFQVYNVAEGFKRNTTAYGEAMQSGLLSTFVLGMELGNAGTGINTAQTDLAWCAPPAPAHRQRERHRQYVSTHPRIDRR